MASLTLNVVILLVSVPTLALKVVILPASLASLVVKVVNFGGVYGQYGVESFHFLWCPWPV